MSPPNHGGAAGVLAARDARIATLEAKRDRLAAELAARQGREVELREALESLLQACGMEPHGRIHHGGLVAPSLERADAARSVLSHPSPAAQAIGRVLALVEEAANEECEFGIPCCEASEVSAVCWPCRSREALADYQDLRSGQREDQPPGKPAGETKP